MAKFFLGQFLSGLLLWGGRKGKLRGCLAASHPSIEEEWTAGWAGLGEAKEPTERRGPLELMQPELAGAPGGKASITPRLKLAPFSEINLK